MTEILIGCPVLHRDWVLPAWFEHMAVACRIAGVVPKYIFVGDPDRDPETAAVIEAFAPGALVPIEDVRPMDQRDWRPPRIKRMVEVRNALLVEVRERKPDLFFSVDSDILLDPNGLQVLLYGMTEKDAAIGGKVYLSKDGTASPSWGRMTRMGMMDRQDAIGCFPVEVIMAVKLMKPAAYAIDYEFHREGEDLGWSLACGRAGLKLRWDGSVANKHVWDAEALDTIDTRVGF